MLFVMLEHSPRGRTHRLSVVDRGRREREREVESERSACGDGAGASQKENKHTYTVTNLLLGILQMA